MHVRIVETVFHDAPRFFEDLPAFGGPVDDHADGKRNTAGGRAAAQGSGRACTAAATPAGYRGRLHGQAAGRILGWDAYGINSAALQEVNGSSIARPLRFAEPARKAAPPPAAPFVWSYRGVQAFQLGSVFVNDIEARSGSSVFSRVSSRASHRQECIAPAIRGGDDHRDGRR